MIRDLQWTTLSAVVTRVGSVVTLPLLTRTLGTEQFGLYKSIFVATSLFLTGTLVLRTKTVLQKYIPQQERRTGVTSAFFLVLIAVLALSILIFHLFVHFSLIEVASPEASAFLSAHVTLFSYLLFALFLDTFAIAVCKGLQDFRRFSLAKLLREVSFAFGIAFSFVAGFESLSWIISLYATTRLLGAVYVGMEYYDVLLIRPSFLKLWEQLAEVALPLAPTAILKRITGNIPDLLIISTFGLKVFGAWSIVFVFTTALQLFTRPVSQIALPKISERENNSSTLSGPLVLYYRYITFVSIPIAVGGWLVGPELIAFLFTPQMLVSRPVIGILITAFSLQMYVSISGQFFVGTGKSVYVTYGEAIRVVTKLSVVALGTVVLESLLVTAVAYLLEIVFFSFFVGWYQSRFIIFDNIPLKQTIRYVAALLIMIATVIVLKSLFINSAMSPIIVLTAGAVYAGGLFAMGLIRREEKELLRRLLSD